MENKNIENKNLGIEPEKKATADKKPKDKIAAELDDEALSKVAGGDSTDKSEDESQDNHERDRGIFKPIIL